MALPFTGRKQFRWESTPSGQHTKTVEEAFGQTRLHYGLTQPIQAPLLQGPERSQQVPAIHRGNKPGNQWLKRTSVIPVQYVPAMLCKTGYRGQCSESLFSKFRDREIPKFAPHLPRVEEKPDVRGRYPCRYRGRFLLNVVRYQPVVLRSAVLGKISPGVQSRTAKKGHILGRSAISCRGRSPVKPNGNQFAAGPKQ